MRKFSILLAGVLVIAAMLACNLPSAQGINAATTALAQTQTAAALTMQAAMPASATPMSTSTFTPVPFPTLPPATLPVAATATSNCDNAHFVKDVTYADNTVVTAGDSFTKTWRLQNTGSCSWSTSYALVFTSGELMGGPSTQALVGNVNPGETVDVSVGLTAPSSNGTHVGHWALRNPSGVVFGTFYVQIVVGSGGGGGGAFAVTGVTYTFSTVTQGSNHDCPTVAAHITTNGAGDVQYHWTHSDGASASVETLHFGSAGSLSIHETWFLGHVWNGTSHWMGIYIDAPNHQNFGHLSFTTACTSP